MEKYTSIILLGATLGATFGVAFAYFRKGNRSESGEIIEFYKKQAGDYKEMLEATRKEYTEKHEALIKEVGVIKGELNTERQLRQQYEAILKDKNPETEAFMKLMVQAVKDQGEVNKEVVSVLKDLHTMAKAEAEREIQIDTHSSITKS